MVEERRKRLRRLRLSHRKSADPHRSSHAPGHGRSRSHGTGSPPAQTKSTRSLAAAASAPSLASPVGVGAWEQGPLSPGIVGLTQTGRVVGWDEDQDGPFPEELEPPYTNIWTKVVATEAPPSPLPPPAVDQPPKAPHGEARRARGDNVGENTAGPGSDGKQSPPPPTRPPPLAQQHQADQTGSGSPPSAHTSDACNAEADRKVDNHGSTAAGAAGGQEDRPGGLGRGGSDRDRANGRRRRGRGGGNARVQRRAVLAAHKIQERLAPAVQVPVRVQVQTLQMGLPAGGSDEAVPTLPRGSLARSPAHHGAAASRGIGGDPHHGVGRGSAPVAAAQAGSGDGGGVNSSNRRGGGGGGAAVADRRAARAVSPIQVLRHSHEYDVRDPRYRIALAAESGELPRHRQKARDSPVRPPAPVSTQPSTQVVRSTKNVVGPGLVAFQPVGIAEAARSRVRVPPAPAMAPTPAAVRPQHKARGGFRGDTLSSTAMVTPKKVRARKKPKKALAQVVVPFGGGNYDDSADALGTHAVGDPAPWDMGKATKGALPMWPSAHRGLPVRSPVGPLDSGVGGRVEPAAGTASDVSKRNRRAPKVCWCARCFRFSVWYCCRWWCCGCVCLSDAVAVALHVCSRLVPCA